MKAILFTALALPFATADAQVYACPQFYPVAEAGPQRLPLTNATMNIGEKNGQGRLHGSDEPAKDGSDTHYGFPGTEPRWLVCWYGGRKRIKGNVIDHHEWGQYVADHYREWWIQVDPKANVCRVQIREAKSADGGSSTWTATATCEQ
jgi:hypothetical protein